MCVKCCGAGWPEVICIPRAGVERRGNLNRNISQAGNILKQFHKARLDQVERQVRNRGAASDYKLSLQISTFTA